MYKATQISLHRAQDQLSRGHIYSYHYDKERNDISGTIQDQDNEQYPFSIDASIHEALREEMLIPVDFEISNNDEDQRAVKISLHSKKDQPPRGHIFSYHQINEPYGFIRPENENEEDIRFSFSDITDEALRKEMLILVNFEVVQGDPQRSRGYIYRHALSRSGQKYILIKDVVEDINQPKDPEKAVKIYRANIRDWYELAESAADYGDYSKAISHINQVLKIDENYPNAQENYDKWREYERKIARGIGVPKGKNPYARAKRAHWLEEDLDKAEGFFRQAILQNDNLESAVNDLASLLSQRERFTDAIEVLKKNRSLIRNKRSLDRLDNLLTRIYKKAGMHDEAITLWKVQLQQTSTPENKVVIQWEIATSCLAQNKFKDAEKLFREILNHQPDRIAAKRNLAYCLSKQKRYDDAEKLLKQILDVSLDEKATEILEAVQQAKQTGDQTLIDNIILIDDIDDIGIERELSIFAQFFLKRCPFRGVEQNRIEDGKYTGSKKDFGFDIKRLEERAKREGTRHARERSEYCLSAAILHRDKGRMRNHFRFLCRSFASKGDAAVSQNMPVDTIRAWYYEALKTYDRIQDYDYNYDEQDAVNALSRFLFSYLGRERIRTSPQRTDENAPILKQQVEFITDTVKKVIAEHSQKDEIFDAIGYLSRSRYAKNRISNCLYKNLDLRNAALEYLQGKGINISDSKISLNDFDSLWDELKNRDHPISSDLKSLNKFTFSPDWLEDSIQRAENICLNLFFQLDQQRVRKLQKIFETSLELLKQVTFGEQEHLCIQLDNSCQNELEEIESSPTKLSVEYIHPIIEVIQQTVKEHLEKLYKTSKPELTLSMSVERYPYPGQADLDVDILVENKLGCSPAQALELIVNKDDKLFELTQPEINSEESLSGGSDYNFSIPLKLTAHALQSETFSLSAHARYRYRSAAGKTEESKSEDENFTIQLYSEKEFKKIINPYHEGRIVKNPDMFYGRWARIKTIADSIRQDPSQNKCVVIYGQKRSGKSSMKYHLQKELEDQNLVILDMGNIGRIVDEDYKVPFSTQFLWLILDLFKKEIQNRNSGSSPLDISFPSRKDFYDDPTPMILFEEVFNAYQECASAHEDWQDVQLVLFIDEFSYIYGQILEGHIPASFMKNWKAWMEEDNYFNAVLIGQDIMEQFIETQIIPGIPNPFAIAQQERITYLEEEYAKKLIVEPIMIGGPEGENRYSEESAINRIIELTACSPFYIQMFCRHLVDHLNEKQAIYVTYSYVEHVKNNLMRGPKALKRSNFDNLYNSGEDNRRKDDDMLKILKTIAVHSQTGMRTCRKNDIKCDTEQSLGTLLDELKHREVIDQKQEGYFIKVGLFKEWLIQDSSIDITPASKNDKDDGDSVADKKAEETQASEVEKAKRLWEVTLESLLREREVRQDDKFVVADAAQKLKQTELALREAITNTMQKIYGDNWITELEGDRPHLKGTFNACRNRREEAERHNRTLLDLIHYATFRHLFKIIFSEWHMFEDIFGHTQQYWNYRSELLVRVRNEDAHHIIKEGTPEWEVRVAKAYCNEILIKLGVGEE